VARAADRLRRLVGNLSATARLERQEVDVITHPVPAGEVIDRAAMEFGTRRDRLRLPSRRRAATELWADVQLAAQALVVLIENALDHSPDGEPVVVDVDASGSEVRISVTDRGPGVDPAVAGRIFKAFAQADASTSRAHEGLGIGLYLARQIMAAHDGRVEHVPRDGAGTTFVLAFPQAASRPLR
jgi:signal transduction histidine kinase